MATPMTPAVWSGAAPVLAGPAPEPCAVAPLAVGVEDPEREAVPLLEPEGAGVAEAVEAQEAEVGTWTPTPPQRPEARPMMALCSSGEQVWLTQHESDEMSSVLPQMHLKSFWSQSPRLFPKQF